jgi:hypothetical protein
MPCLIVASAFDDLASLRMQVFPDLVGTASIKASTDKMSGIQLFVGKRLRLEDYNCPG